MILLLLAAVSACGGGSSEAPAADRIVSIVTPVPAATASGGTPAETAAPVVTQTPDGTEPPAVTPTSAPTSAPTAVPTAIPSDEPFVPGNVTEAILRYEGYPLGYASLDRPAVGPNEPIEAPRYTMGDDGIYHSSSASDDNEAVIMLTGDLMCQSRQQLTCRRGATYNFNGCFEYVKSLFSKADFVVGNLEATLCASAPYMSEQTFVDGSPNLNAPANFLEAIRYAGYDMVVMSNNHNCDAGVTGIYDTLDQVDQYRLLHTGTFRNSEETRYVIADIDGINVGFLSYSTYFNHKEEHLTNEGQRILLNPYSPEAVQRDTAAAKAAGAEFVIVYIHWGVEYKNDPTLVVTIPMKEKLSGEEFSLRVPLDYQLQIAQELADAGVDYIIGSHPHALQPYTKIQAADGRQVPIIYSLGNFVSHQKKDISKDTVILRIILKKDSSGRVYVDKEGYVPARLLVSYQGNNYTVVPITKPYSGGASSNEFMPAYYRIVKAIGSKIAVMGSM